jgi:hypothetical protein
MDTHPHKEDEMDEQREAEERFDAAFKGFIDAGLRLSDAWDGVGFNADELLNLPESLRPPMSLDDWMFELLAHYESKRAAV